MAYASRTGTKRNLDALEGAGWRLLATPESLKRYRHPSPTWADHAPAPYALDNGAWTAFTKGQPFDGGLFRDALAQLGAGADWIVCPDIVAGGLKSLAFSVSWLAGVRAFGRALIAVQDGMSAADVRGLLGAGVGIAVGGSTPWKLGSLPVWARLSRETGCHLHVLRVNTVRRIRYCQEHGVHSFDGTSATKWAVNIPRLNAARRTPTGQTNLFSKGGTNVRSRSV
jgi:hypothetical protein